jgi:hypothetical protein
MPIRKIEAGRIITVASSDWVGPLGTIWYDEILGDLRIGDDVTPGGRLLGTGGGGSTDLTYITTNVLPATNGTLNLGSATKQWKTLYVSSSTVYIGGKSLTVNSDNTISINGVNLSTRGAQGTTGDQGVQGIQGTTGIQGYTGIQGTIGVQGATGIGIQGAAGASTGTSNIVVGTTPPVSASTGTLWYDEFSGRTYIYYDDTWVDSSPNVTDGRIVVSTTIPTNASTGTLWYDENSGRTYIYYDNTWVDSNPATDGAQGTTGAQGIIGAQGIGGIQGFTGIQGSIGVQGTIGTQGIIGVQGFTGIQGTDGIQGTIGVQGTTGIQGTGGVQGPQGFLVAGSWLPILSDEDLRIIGPGSFLKWQHDETYNSVRSNIGFDDGAYASARFGELGYTGHETTFGLTERADERSPGEPIGYGFVKTETGTASITENGTEIVTDIVITTSTVLSVVWDGVSVKYYQENTLLHTTPREVEVYFPLYFDSSFYRTGASILDAVFGPYALGIAGAQGITGVQGADGIQGASGVSVQGVQGPAGVNTGTSNIVVGIQPPVSASTGTLWYDEFSGRTYIYYDDTWVDSSPNVSENRIVVSTTVPVNASTGTLWYDENSGRTYIYYDDTWVDSNPATDGAQGTTGIQGTIGAQGTTGSQGTTGIQGSLGVQGTIGAQGTIGSQGTTGIQGSTGVGSWLPIIDDEDLRVIGIGSYQKWQHDSSYNSIRSTTGFIYGCYTSARFGTLGYDGHETAFGLSANANERGIGESIEYGFVNSDNSGFVSITENGTEIVTNIAITTASILSVVFDGINVNYYKEHNLLHSTQRSILPAFPLYFDSSFYRVDSSLLDVIFGSYGGYQGVEVSLINTASNAISTVTNVTAIRFDEDSGFDLTNLGNGAVKIAMNSTFKYWKVDGQNTLVANGLDTIKFVEGAGIKITTNTTATPDKTITFGVNLIDGGFPDSVY